MAIPVYVVSGGKTRRAGSVTQASRGGFAPNARIGARSKAPGERKLTLIPDDVWKKLVAHSKRRSTG